jgi:hypothetical protein
MFNEVYETTPCKGYKESQQTIKSALQRELIDDTLGYAQTPIKGIEVNGIYTVPNAIKTSTVGVFQHPVVVKRVSGDEVIVVDTRAFTGVRTDKATSITGLTEYNFLVLRARLQQAWMQGKRYELSTCGVIVIQAFCRWVSEAITRRLNMTPQDQMKLAITTGIYYLELFQPPGELDESAKLKIATQVARACYVQVSVVLEVYDQLNRLEDINAFVAALKVVVPNERTELLTTGLLYSILGGSWFGNNAREVVAVALEYPPVFIAMIYTSLVDRSYRRSFLAELVENLDRRGQPGKDFMASLTALLDIPHHV